MPNFAAWSHENLAKFAEEAYARIKQQQEALEQSRLDLKDAMKLVRDKLTKNENHSHIQ
jgi:hypothetical protein